MKFRILKMWDKWEDGDAFILQKKRRWFPGWRTLSKHPSMYWAKYEYENLVKAERAEVVWTTDEEN